MHLFLLTALSAGFAHAAASDPCTLATASTWVTSKVAHACELNVPFDKARSTAVINSTIKSLQYYSLENWFLHSPNPLIPHDVNIRALLNNVQKTTVTTGYKTDWDFNIAIADAYDREADGHTIYTAECIEAFSYNLPFSIGTLATTPFDTTAVPIFLVNYDFPEQGRDGMEAFFESIGVNNIRPLDGSRILEINGVDASSFLVDLATRSSIFDGLFGSFETVEPRFMRLMSRYSADTVSGAYTQEVGRFGQRAVWPGTDSITVTLQTANGSKKTLTIPWAATFVGSGNTTASFIAETCLVTDENSEARKRKRELRASGTPLNQRRKAVIPAGNQAPVRKAAANAPPAASSGNLVTPNLKSFGHFVTLDIYQLAEHPKVGVVYIEQFEPQDDTGAQDYFDGISDTLFTGLTALKAAGVEHVLIDQSGNRGGFIFAGAIAMWSLFPLDLYPGFPAVFRETDLIKREADIAAATSDIESEYFFGNYRDLNYVLLQNNSQIFDPPVPQTVNGVKDAFSKRFFDDFGPGSSGVTNFTSPPFEGKDLVFVANSICASTCSIFSSYLFQKHGVRSAVFGGTPSATLAQSQFDGGVKGSEVTDLDEMLFELELAGLQDDPAAPQPLPINADITMNFRNAIPFIDQQDGILEFVFEKATKKFQFTKENFNRPQIIWEFVAEEFFGKS